LGEAVAWGFLRQCKDGPVPLSKLLEPILAPGMQLPDAVGNRQVHVMASRKVLRMQVETITSDIEWFENWKILNGTRTIWHGFRKDAGMNLMMRTLDDSMVCIHTVTDKFLDLARAVVRCTLGWQYVSNPT